MAGYQILGIRSYFDEKERKDKRFDAFFEKRWRFDDIAELFKDPLAILDRNKVPSEERWNLFYTVSNCGDSKREFKSLELIPFDVDGIDLSRIAEYIDPILEIIAAPGASVIASGNGLHFLTRISEPFTDKKQHEERRSQYKAILSRINRKLEELRLPGKADPAVWDVARILRMPGTINRKPDKQDKICTILRAGAMAPTPFDWDAISGAPKLDYNNAVSEAALRKYRKHSGEEAMQQCLFLKHTKEDAATLSELEWYAAASVIGRFTDGKELFHSISSPHRSYSPAATDEKLAQALAASGPRTCANINNMWGKCHECPLFGKIKSPIVIKSEEVIATEASGFYDIIEQKDKAPKLVPNYNDLLKAYARAHAFKTISDMKTVYLFKDTHYVDTNPIEIKGFAEKNFSPEPKDTYRTEFVNKVFANEVTRRSFFAEGTENRINFKNGVLELSNDELLAHSSEFGFRSVLPYEYNPSALCPTFDWWIMDVMLGDEDLVSILQEFMGYVVRGGEYTFNKALWLSGTGRNGKSTFIHILKALIGRENYSTLSIKQIVGDRFASASLDGKIANFSEETSPEELADSGPFKNLTGDGEISAQKKYGDEYGFMNRAKLVMSYNEVPVLKDLSVGMISRPIIVPFKRDLSASGAQDITLKKRLLEELPGVFNFALAGWRRLEKNSGFTKSEKSALEMEEIRDSSCSAAQWARENLEFLPVETAQYIKARDLYLAYKSEVGQYSYSEAKFAKRIQAIPNAASRRRRLETGVVYVALRLRGNSSNFGDY